MRLPRITLRKIACFVITADAGSVSASARALNMSPASLSEALTDLENDLETQLLIRHKARGVTLTSEGRRILVEARRLIRHAKEFEALADNRNVVLTGEIIIGCFPTLLPFAIPKLLANLRIRHPGVSLKFSEGSQQTLQQAMLDGQIDFSIMYDVTLSTEFSRQPLYSPKPYVLLSPEHRLANSTDPIDLSLLIDDPLVQIEIRPGEEDQIFQSQGLKPRVAYRTTNFEMVRALVARNFGYAVLVQRPIHDVTYEGLPLIIRSVSNPIPPLVVVLCWPAAVQLNRRQRAFITFCTETFCA